MENNQGQGASKSKVSSYMKINDGKGAGVQEAKDAAGELRKKTIMRRTAAEEDVNELADDFIKMENNSQGASKSRVGSYRKINNGKSSRSEEGKDVAGELRKETIMRQIAADDVNELADGFIKLENNNQGASKSKVGSSNMKINNYGKGGGGGGGEEGKGVTGDLRKKTIMRQIAAEDVNELADDFIKNFKKQLKIERADSIKRFKEMIDRGA